MQRRTTIMAVLSIAIVITLVLGFQAWSLVAQSRHGQGVIVQPRLTGIQYVVDSAAIARGYFTANLTFQNPTTETINLTTVDAAYYEGVVPQNWHGNYALIASGEINTTRRLVPGSSLFSVRINLNRFYGGNASLATTTGWIIKYYPQFGLTACEMIATVTASGIQTTGPYLGSSYSEPYTVLNTYVLSIINTWAIGLEIVAVFLIIEPRAQKTETTPQARTHNIMLSIIYGVQAVGFLAVPYYLSLISALIPLPPLDPYQIQYGGHGAGGLVAGFLYAAALFAGLIGLFLAVALFLRWSWARHVAAALSALGVFGWLYLDAAVLQSSAIQGFTVYNLMVIILFLVIAAANGIVLYIIWRRTRMPRQNELKPLTVLTSDSTK